MTHLVPMTEEQREQIKQKRLADQEYAKANLKTDYADEKFWKDKGSELGIRFPGWWIKGSEVKYVRRACKKLGVEVSEYVESTGFKNLNEFSTHNPKLNAVCMVGLVIEYYLGRDSL